MLRLNNGKPVDNKIYRQVARLHIDNLDQSFLATLGETFLSEMYRALDASSSTVLLVERHEGDVIGFVTGGSSMGPVYKTMLIRVWVWAVPLGLRLLSPKRFKRVFDILKYSRADGDESLPSHELLSIAVGSQARGTGVSAKLYASLVEHFRSDDVKNFKIIVGEALTPAHKFYTKMGAKPHSSLEVHAGETSTLYIHTIVD